jgi:hypothetical protein
LSGNPFLKFFDFCVFEKKDSTMEILKRLGAERGIWRPKNFY